MSIELVIPSNHLSLCCPFSSCPQSFIAPESFPKSWLFAPGGQSTGASALASVLAMNIQGWFLLGLIGMISLLSEGLSRVFSRTTVWKCQFFGTQPSLWSNSHIYTWLLGKPQLWQYGPLSAKSLLFNTPSRFVTAFLLINTFFFFLLTQSSSPTDSNSAHVPRELAHHLSLSAWNGVSPYWCSAYPKLSHFF